MTGDMSVCRIGFGTMSLIGRGHWGAADDPDHSIRMLRHAVEAGVTHIDTADAYGPFTAEKYIRKALHPYPAGLTIATKGGMTRQGPNEWAPCGRPQYLRQCVEMSLRRLQTEQIELYYLHRIDPAVPLCDQIGVFAEMKNEGKIGGVGLSKVTVDQIREANATVDIDAVQNRYNISDQSSADVLSDCERIGIRFMPYAPLATNGMSVPDDKVAELAARYNASPAQVALAWLLQKSTAIVPIPGTSNYEHLRENLAAQGIDLAPADMASVEAATETGDA